MIANSAKRLRYDAVLPVPSSRRRAQRVERVWDTARPEQIAPDGDWRYWLILAGRGWGKTRTLVEYGIKRIADYPRLAIVAPTFADGRDTVVEGESGFLAHHRNQIETWNRSMGELHFTNGARGKIFSADEPDRLRGPQHHTALCDELAAWRYPQATWDMLMMGLRLGDDPRVCAATTPRPIALLKWLVDQPDAHITRGSTFDNRANLAPAFFDAIIARYAGTTIGRQEIEGLIIDDVPGALWSRALLDRLRVVKAPDLVRAVTAIDPSTTGGGDEAGIVSAGVGWCDCAGKRELHGFVLHDDSVQAAPHIWAYTAVTAYHRIRADRLVAESNQGGEMVSLTIGTIPTAPPVKLIHASRGKHARAEPVAALYEQGKVHHVGVFAKLEDELCQWTPHSADSPNRLDALVWALTELLVTNKPTPPVAPLGMTRPSEWR